MAAKSPPQEVTSSLYKETTHVAKSITAKTGAIKSVELRANFILDPDQYVYIYICCFLLIGHR